MSMGPMDKGATSQTGFVLVVDSTTGAPKTGITITNLTRSYERPGSAVSHAALTALTALTDAWASDKGYEVDATYHPGVYRIDWPDAAFATGADRVVLSITVSGGVPAQEVVRLIEPLRRLGKISTATGISSTTFRDTTTSNKDVTDYYKDMIVCFTTGNLKGLGFRCSAYGNNAANNTFTVNTMPENPANGDEFVIIGRATA